MNWNTLTLVDGEGSEVTGEAKIEALREFKATNAMTDVFFQDEAGAADWDTGPAAASDVDWTGFAD